ncbi:MAG: signal peptide peptidase SppA [Deltaproteobacteria bacterium]|jgi:protease IV|nr:signal peptide peptidase SppA [Deltaproteobacteria bacterium]MBT6432478.1 signal peptide peptidase SppA [Deltaproteobacteria bacterium]
MNTFLVSLTLLVASTLPQPDDFVAATEVSGTRRGAAALGWDAGAAGIAQGLEFRLSGRMLGGQETQAATSLAFVVPWESLTIAFGYDWVPVPDGVGYERSTFALALRLGERLSLGTAWRRFEIDGTDTISVDVGLYAEPWRWLAISIFGQRLNEPDFGDGILGSVYGLGLGIRPLGGAPWLTVGSSVRFLRKPGRTFEKTFLTDVSTYVQAEIWQGVYTSLAWQYQKDGSHQVWAGFGLNTNLGGSGLEAEFSAGVDDIDTLGTEAGVDRTHWALTFKEKGEPGLELSSKRAKVWAAGTTRREATTFLGRGESVSTLALRLAKIAGNDSVQDVIIGVSDLNMGLAGVEELRAGIKRIRKSGKTVTAYLSGGDEKSYLVAMAASSIKVDPVSILLLDGFSVTARYFAGALDKVGVRFDAVAVGAYKTGPDALTRTESRPEDKEVRGEILDEAITLLKTSMVDDRGLSGEKVDEILKRGYFSGEEAVAAGLADGIFTPKEAAKLPQKIPNGWSLDSFERADDHWGTPDRIAVIPILGTIVGKPGASPLPGQSAAAENIIPALEEVASDLSVAAVVLRVDSPGGDVMASERIWRAVRRLAQVKPVIVSMGQVAASGGYYVSAPAHTIFAEPNSLTGSIGVFALLPDLSGLYELLGIGTEIEKRGEQADWNSETMALRPEGRSALKKALEHYYDVFIDRVAQGRKVKPERVREVAGGRVYTGRKALELGLVDKFGGLLEAIEEAAKQAGLEQDRYEVEFSERALGKRSLIDFVSASREEPTVVKAWEYLESIRMLSKLPLALMPQWYEVFP